MVVDVRYQHMETIRSVLSLAMYPIQYVVNAPVSAVHWMSDSLSSRQVLLEENNNLRQQNLMLKSQAQRFASLMTENSRLRELLDSSERAGERVLVADLLAVELALTSRHVILNKGAQQGVFLGQPILDADGVMGQVIHINPISSTAMLITDPEHAIPVQVNRNGLRAIATGTGKANELELLHIPSNADIKAGDPYAKVTATPRAKLMRAREVLLVWPEKPMDQNLVSQRED
jgi:rod shape-determining protein MreC